MKKLTAPLAAIVLVLAPGCSLFQQPVPANRFSGQIGAVKFKGVWPKDQSLDHLAVSLDTNGVFRLDMTKLVSVNSVGVITSSYAGQAEFVNALGTQLNAAIATGAKLGAAAVVPKP